MSTEEIQKLEEKKLELSQEIASIQLQLGQPRMFDSEGVMLDVEEFALERQRLKRACGWRLNKYQKVKAELRAAREAARSPIGPRPDKIYRTAFSLICDDMAAKLGESPKDIAQMYIRRAEGKEPIGGTNHEDPINNGWQNEERQAG